MFPRLGATSKPVARSCKVHFTGGFLHSRLHGLLSVSRGSCHGVFPVNRLNHEREAAWPRKATAGSEKECGEEGSVRVKRSSSSAPFGAVVVRRRHDDI